MAMTLPPALQEGIDQAQARFVALAPRERMAVVAAAIFVIGALLWLAVFQPLNTSIDRLQTQLESERSIAQQLAQARADLAVLRSGSAPAVQGNNQTVMALVDSTGRGAGFSDSLRVQPDGNSEARVWLSDVSFDSTIGWVRQLETRYGLAVTAADVTGKDDKPGQVDARITVER